MKKNSINADPNQNQIRKDIGKEAKIRKNRWERKSEWNTISSDLKRKYKKSDRKAWHKHVIAPERDTEKH